MFKEFSKRTRLILFVVLLILPMVLQGCGGNSGYDSPSTTGTSTAMSADTLKSWVDSGDVNGTGYNRVVILDVNTQTTYESGHIPGAQFLNRSDILPVRSEGIVSSVNMVLDGSSMDALIKKYGIDKNTTIVITGPGSSYWDYMWVGRAYFNFRYWGFPKSRLKVLNGLDGAYREKYGLSTAPAPSIIPSTYSVRNNPLFRSDLRVSLQEMMDVADGKVPNALVIDGRGGNGYYSGGSTGTASYDGDPMKTKGVFDSKADSWGDICTYLEAAGVTAPPCQPSPTAGDYVAFEGHIRDGKAIWFADLFEKVETTDPSSATFSYYRFLPKNDMAALLTTETGLDSTKVAYVHCRTGMISSAMFVAIDANLGWPVENYDGSWSQWGQLAGVTNGGILPDDSKWRTDIPSRTENLYFNTTSGATIENPADGGSVNPYDTSANKIEETDKAYFESGSGGGTGTGGPPPQVGC